VTAPASAKGSLLGKLDAFREQAGNVIGELYARTARTFLQRLETIQDREAQRRFRRHGKPVAPSPSMTPGATSEAESPSSTPTTSV